MGVAMKKPLHLTREGTNENELQKIFKSTVGNGKFYLYNQFSFKSWKFEKSVAISLLKNSWPLILSGIVISIYMKIDQVMIK
mgnify:CR=1 FL=1